MTATTCCISPPEFRGRNVTADFQSEDQLIFGLITTHLAIFVMALFILIEAHTVSSKRDDFSGNLEVGTGHYWFGLESSCWWFRKSEILKGSHLPKEVKSWADSFIFTYLLEKFEVLYRKNFRSISRKLMKIYSYADSREVSLMFEVGGHHVLKTNR